RTRAHGCRPARVAPQPRAPRARSPPGDVPGHAMSGTGFVPSHDRRALLEEYLRSRGSSPASPSPAPHRDAGATLPLSSCQEQVWLHGQLDPGAPVYNEAVTIHYDGVLDVAAFERSFRDLARRHEAWRTGFEVHDGQPRQRVYDDVR